MNDRMTPESANRETGKNRDALNSFQVADDAKKSFLLEEGESKIPSLSFK